MKYANVKQNNMLYENRIILLTVEDVYRYFDAIEPEFQNGIKSLIKTSETMERWGHLIRHNNFGSLLAMASAKTYINGGNTLLELAKVYDLKMFNMITYIISGKRIMVNDVGGYCFINHNSIIEYIDEPVRKIDYYISEHASYINLENDPILEDYTVRNFPDRSRISYIFNSFSLTQDELSCILQEFKSKGGYGIWQYTTAMDIDQLYMYINTGISVGLTDFIINFNAGTNKDIEDLIEFYKNLHGSINFQANFV